MEDSIFREESLERVNSPDELKDHIHVTSPSLWFVITAIIILLLGFLAWGIFGTVEVHNLDGSIDIVHPISFVLG